MCPGLFRAERSEAGVIVYPCPKRNAPPIPAVSLQAPGNGTLTRLQDRLKASNLPDIFHLLNRSALVTVQPRTRAERASIGQPIGKFDTWTSSTRRD